MYYKIKLFLFGIMIVTLTICGCGDSSSSQASYNSLIDTNDELLEHSIKPETPQSNSGGIIIESITPGTLPLSGGEVYITGRRFLHHKDSIEVFVGGIPADSITVIDSKTILIIAPRAPAFGSADVIVRIPNEEVVMPNGLFYQEPQVILESPDPYGEVEAKGFTDTVQGPLLFWTGCVTRELTRFDLLDLSGNAPLTAASFNTLTDVAQAGLILMDPKVAQNEEHNMWRVFRRGGFCHYPAPGIMGGSGVQAGYTIYGNIEIQGGVYIFEDDSAKNSGLISPIDSTVLQVPKPKIVTENDPLFGKFMPTNPEVPLTDVYYQDHSSLDIIDFTQEPEIYIYNPPPPPPEPLHYVSYLGDFRGLINAFLSTGNISLLDNTTEYPTNQLATIDIDGSFSDAVIEGDWLAAQWADIPTQAFSLSLINIQDPKNPLIEADLATPGNSYILGDVLIDSGFAYVSLQTPTPILWVIDLASPGPIRSIGTIELPCHAYDLISYGSSLYAAAGQCGILTITNSN